MPQFQAIFLTDASTMVKHKHKSDNFQKPAKLILQHLLQSAEYLHTYKAKFISCV